MLVWVLMILDAVSFVNLSLLHFGIGFSKELLLFSAVYLIGKAVAFREVMSIIDGVWGIYMLLAFFFGVQSFFYWLILVWIIYKFIPLLMDRG